MTTPEKRILRALENKPAFMPYFPLGFPDFDTSLDIIRACCKAGADLMELGIPFSDPLADGPTIQYATQVALENGMTVARAIEGVRKLRAAGVSQPFLLMGYFNPILAYGLERFVADAAEAGADGFIIPDLPPDEGRGLEAFVSERQMGLSYLVSPNSPADRIRRAAAGTKGFLYLVSITGITGSRSNLPAGLAAFVERTREVTAGQTPLAVGFGISTPEQARAVGLHADGVIVGSALIKAVQAAAAADEDLPAAAYQFVQTICGGLRD